MVVCGVALCLPELLRRHLPHPVHILGTGLADGHGSMHRRGWREGEGWHQIIDYHVLHWDVVVSGCLPASRSAAMAAISLWFVVRPSRRALEHEEAMVDTSGVDKRKGKDVDDCGYGRRNSLYSNGGRRRDGRVAPEYPPWQPRIINVGCRQTDGWHLSRLKAEQSPAPGSGAGSADRFGRKARAGEGGGLGGPGQ